MNLQIISRNKRLSRAPCVIPLALLLIGIATTASSDEPRHGIVNPLSKITFEAERKITCLSSATENGDPDTGPSTIILKAAPGCLVPWHVHTAEEQLLVISGAVKAEMGTMEPATLTAGGFAMMPGKEKHQFACTSQTECLMFVTFDRKYDVMWLDLSKTTP
jgi:quercetin dioxygenase-like cupin family protein